MPGVIPIRPGRPRRPSSAEIDEFGRLQHELKPKNARLDELRNVVKAFYDTKPENQAFLEEGDDYSLQISERAMERTIFNMAKLKNLLGLRTFLKFCKFSMADVDANVPTVRHKDFLKKEQTGSRKYTAVARTPVREMAA